MDFEEFCAAASSPYQLEALDRWEEIAGTAFQQFEQEGNRVISVEELAQVFMMISMIPSDTTAALVGRVMFVWIILLQFHYHGLWDPWRSNIFSRNYNGYPDQPFSVQELNLAPTHYSIVQDWIRKSDGKLNFLGFTKFLHGVTIRGSNTRRH